MIDWEEFFLKGVLVVVVAFCAFVVVAAVCQGVYESKHPCVKYGTPYYHAPTYVMVGKVMVPEGGGTYGDCVERKP